MKLFDTRIPVHETPDDQPAISTKIEILDNMLTQYGIEHYFAAPTEEEMSADKKPLVYQLYYQSEQNIEVTLVVSLFIKLHLNGNEKTILEGITKSFKNI